MKHEIIILKRARKFIEKQPKKTAEKILRAIYKLPEGDIKPLRGHADVYRLRIDDIRVIYTFERSKITITVVDAGSRGQIYNRY